MSNRKSLTQGGVRSQVIKHDKKIKRLILKKLRGVKFPVKIKPETLKFSSKQVDLNQMDFEVPTFYMRYSVRFEDTRWITEGRVDGDFSIDLSDMKSGKTKNLMDCSMHGDWEFFAYCADRNYRVDWKA